MVYPTDITDERVLRIRGKQVEQILMHWTWLQVDDTQSWEEKIKILMELYPSLNLKDKVIRRKWEMIEIKIWL